MIKSKEFSRQVVMQLGGREERSKKGEGERGREEEKEELDYTQGTPTRRTSLHIRCFMVIN